MCKSEIFAKIINIVSKETEVSVDQILSSDKNMGTVDARYLLVFFLFESGMYPSQTAAHIHKTKRAVNYMISNSHERMESGEMMGIYWDDIHQEELNGLGEAGRYVSKEYLYTQIQKRIGLSTRSISYIIDHTQKIDIKVIYQIHNQCQIFA